MKTGKKILCSLLIAAVLLALGGCAGSQAQLGQWEDNVFTNDWFEITVTIPDGYQVLGADEIQNILGAGQEAIINDGLMTAEELDEAEGNTIYDFYVFDPTETSSLALGYEKLPASVSEEEYLDSVKINLESLQSLEYELGQTETVTLGKHEYMKMTASLNGGAVSQEYYVNRKDGYMGFLIVTCNPETQNEIQEIIGNIE